MARRFLLLLIAALALASGLYAFRSGKPARRPAAANHLNSVPVNLSSPATRNAGSPAHPTSRPLTARPASNHSSLLTSRLALLVVLALALTAVAHFGLGKGSPLVQAAQTLESPGSSNKLAAASYSPSPLSGNVRALFAGESLLPPAAPTPAATPAPPPPTPAVAAAVATPAPTPRPAPPIPADGIEGIICALPWPCQEAIAVAACESGRDRYGRLDGSSDTNGSHYGVFQISSIHAWRWPDFWENWMDPAKNAQWAYEIWAEQGWKPWSCRWAIYG